MQARLVVAVDGGDSAVRRALGIRAAGHGYGHDAIITTVTPDRPRPGWAFERFTETGPLALLPMTAGRWSLVWTCREDGDGGPARARGRRLPGPAAGAFRLSARPRLGQAAPRRAYPLNRRPPRP